MGQHTVRVGGVSLQATEHDIRDFFSFSGEILHVELQREKEWSQVAFVTFQNADALDTALLLSGAKIIDQPVNIIPVEGYVLPTSQEHEEQLEDATGYEHSTENKGTAVITDVLSRGYQMGKIAAISVKQFDEKHGLTATAVATAATVDQKLGLTDKFSAGTSAINQQIRAVDERYQVSGKTKSAFAVAEEKVNIASTAILKNRYVASGTTWLGGAFSKVAKAAGEVGQKARERATGSYDRTDRDEYYGGGDSYADVYSRVSTEPAAVSLNSAASSRGYDYDGGMHSYTGQSGVSESGKPPPAQGLIL